MATIWSSLTSADSAKSTTLSSDLDICCWDGLKCNHPDHVLPEDMKSSDLSRYPPPMMLGLAGAISKKLQDIGKISSRPTISWNTMASTDPHVVHRDPVSDRPSSLPLAHRISLMDENLVVQLGFRTRPLRDGGGKPSPGRLPPPLRRASTLAQLGARIQQLTDPFSQAVRMSISCGEKNHPFSDSLLHQIREAMGGDTNGWGLCRPTFLPYPHLPFSQGGWRPGLGIPAHSPGGGSLGSRGNNIDLTGHLADQRRTTWYPR